ncbi:arabinofuranan 3-O-arabinosyltransferase [Nocardioides daedukensis]|uniref:Arabinofuranan 3-O-arabinosyltransferase n=1 Tax=Nocardioides daedukensis TaxID=634462 RepID=A0A7Y9UVM1_9ACTN|nr:DUF3367 domain-containing protein [Nocardioides daedukensis]NYG57915.1 arabinofuranan 3-O-arabinosyltransferase [Nocardioides daedukensis]
MESHDRAAQEVSADASVVLRFTLRLVAGCAVLVGLALVQSPGLIVPDTKLDLAIAPAEFLGRAAHLWDSQAAFGQLQNQAYGYLWPMGPIFALGSLMDIDPWVVQRLWVALIMCVAFVGVAKLTRAMGVRSDLACILAAFSYALSPRMLTTLGPISIEAWPSALAPWVLLPLVIGSTSGSPRRAAALAGFAVAMVGGVNAAATAAVLPLGAIWLLTRATGPRRRSLMVWWPFFTLLGTLWWIVPLLVMGAYSPPFLDYIESSGNTTFSTTMFDALRGTSNWVPYVDSNLRAGNDLIENFYLPLNSTVLIVAGLIGLVLRSNPHRLFLTCGLVGGLFLVTMGHLGAVQGWFAPDLQTMLDGPLAPLRNVHKFDPVIRLPLVIGLAWTLEALTRERHAAVAPGLHADRFTNRVFTAAVTFAVIATTVPALTGRITPEGGFESVPDYWYQASSWLTNHQGQGVALLVPGSSFATYAWGTPEDEPMQALAGKPWAVRNAVPLAPAPNIRMLDAIEDRLSQGKPSAGLAAFLERAGVSHVVVRNDLAREPDIPDPVLVHLALASPGFIRVASFGPDVGGGSELRDNAGRRVIVNGGWQDTWPAIEIYQVGSPSFAIAADSPPVVVGGPEDLLDLTDLGLLRQEPTVLAADKDESEPLPSSWILTDGLRATERNFGRVHDGRSATRARGQELRLPGRVADYELPDHQRWATWAGYEGIEKITASSSQADATAYGPVAPGELPWAAFDKNYDSEWVSGPYPGVDGHWVEVQFPASRAPGQVRLTGGGAERQRVRVRTDAETSREVTLTPGIARTVLLEKPSDSMRIEDVSDRGFGRMWLAEVEVEGLKAERFLQLPRIPSAWNAPAAVVLRAVADQRTGCAELDDAVRCVQGREIASEEPDGFHRRFTLPEGADYQGSLLVRPRPGKPLVDLLTQDLPAGAESSSDGNPDVRSSALAAIDGDTGTTWTAALSDKEPELRLRWLGKRDVTGLSFKVAKGAAARAPSRIRVTWPGGERVVDLDNHGQASIDGIRTSFLDVTVLEANAVTDLRFDNTIAPVPIGVSEVEVDGVEALPLQLSTLPVVTSCGTGPTLTINGVEQRTRVRMTPSELYKGREVTAVLCGVPHGRVVLGAGENSVSVSGAEAFSAASLTLQRAPVFGATEHPISSEASSPDRRNFALRGVGQFATRENVNPGWKATQDGTVLSPRSYDGWRQGWTGAKDGAATAEFTPDKLYRWGIFGGFLGLVVLCGALYAMRRRRTDSGLPAVGTAHLTGRVVLVSAILVGGLLGGWAGSCVGLVTVGVVAYIASKKPEYIWLLPGVVVPSGLAYTLSPWGSEGGWAGSSTWVGQLALSAVIVVVAALAFTGVEDTRVFRRRNGNSTHR